MLSQILGLSLALATAIGCIAYERLVKNFSIGIIFLLAALFYAPAFAFMLVRQRAVVLADIGRLCADRRLLWAAIIYFLCWVTTPLWFIITKRQSVLVGSIYEIKYIVMLAVIYLFFGNREINLNTGIGITLALASIWFISRA